MTPPAPNSLRRYLEANLTDGDPIYAQMVNMTEVYKVVSDYIQALLDRVEKEVIKVPPCNCKHSRQIVGEQRTSLERIRKRHEDATS